MGNILPKSTSNLEKLDRIVKAINRSEAFYFELQRKRELWVNNLITYGSSLYFLVGVFIYASRWENTPGNRKYYIFYYILYPVILIVLKEFISWVFKLRLNNTTSKLNCLRSQKREIMYAIMKAESYDKSKYRSDRSESSALPNTFQRSTDSRVVSAALLQKKRLSEKLDEFEGGERCCGGLRPACSKCGTRNGTALGEELGYVTFKCYNCHFPNPARKLRPCSSKLGTQLTTLKK